MSTILETLRQHASAQSARLGTARYAIVSAVDPVTHTVKVTIQPEGVESGWIQDAGLAAGTLRISAPAEIGTHVLVEAAEGDAEHPVIVARLFDVQVAPATSPATGKPAQPGEYLIVAGAEGPPGSNQTAADHPAYLHVTPAAIYVGAAGHTLTLDSAGLHLTVGGQMTTLTGSLLTVGVPMQVDGDVHAGTISAQQHTHGGVQSGSSRTSTPA